MESISRKVAARRRGRRAGPGRRRRCSGRSDRHRREPVAEGLRRRLAAEEAQRIDGHLAELGISSSAAAWASAATAPGSSSCPWSRAACLARLAAAAIRIGGSNFGSSARASDVDRVDLAAVGQAGVERLERAQRQGDVLGQRGFSFWSSSCASRSVSSPSSLGSLPSLGSFWIRLASSKADRQLADGEPEQPDVLHRVAFAAGQLAEQEPDHDHDRDDHRRDHEQLDDETGRGGLDRGQVGERRGPAGS